MARMLTVLLSGVWLAGMCAAGSAWATIHDLGALSPGFSGPLFATLKAGDPFSDTYAFDLSSVNSTVGASAVSLNVIPGSASSFDITAELFAFQAGSFVSIEGPVTGSTVLLNQDIAVGSGGDASSANRHYKLVLSGTAPSSGISTYGGSLSIAAVPESSTVVAVFVGLLALLSLSRRGGRWSFS